MDKYSEFDSKLEGFIDKYYKLLILKGFILFIILCAIILLALSSIEYVGWFSNSGRLFLLLFGIVSSFFIFSYFFVIPLLRYLGFLKRLTKRKTEQIIRENLPYIKDYVLNIIELKELEQKFRIDNDLVLASINQKIEITSKFDFQKVLTTRKIYPIIKYLLSIFILYLFIFIFNPTIFSAGSNRIIHFNKVYNKDLGYTIVINEDQLIVEKGMNLNFSVTIEGEKIPDFLSYFIGKNEFLMTKVDNRNYSSLIKGVNKSFSFRIGNDQFKSILYNVKVINPPVLDNFTITTLFPSYINKPIEVVNGISNLKVPVGSKLSWTFSCIEVDSLEYISESDSIYFIKNNGKFFFDSTIYSSSYYSVTGLNLFMERELVPKSYISVIPDLYPDISLIQVFDDNNKKLVFFKGHIYDDYGFSQLLFVINDKRMFVPINVNINNQDFFFSYEFEGNLDRKYNYFFEIYDNDGVNGAKSTRSFQYNFEIPDFQELAKYMEDQDKDIFNKIEKSLLLAEEFKRDIESLREKMYSEKLSSFEKQQLIEELKNKQSLLEQMVNEFSNQNLNKNKQFDSFNEKDENLLKKQEEIQKLLDNVMTDELRALLDELEKLSQEFNKNDLNKKLEKLELNYDQLSQQLDRNLELLQKFEIEKNLNVIANELDKISINQNNLDGQEIKNNLDSIILDDIDKLNKLKEQYNNVLDKNGELENPYKLESLEDEFDKLSNQFHQSLDSTKLQKKESKTQFSENSKKSKELSDKIEEMINNNRVEEKGENSETLRQILENLIYFSFTQESINENFISTSKMGPNFIDNVKRQNDLSDIYLIIKDSLLDLSKRTPELGNHISKKVNEIESSLFDITLSLTEYNLSMSRNEQRKVMELSNDLILLLSESLKNMDTQGEGGEGKQKKKNKPKQSKPSIAEMRKSQESMKAQLENMIKQMKDGKPGSGKPSSEQLGKMLAQQEMFNQMMNQLQNSSVGKDFQKKLNEINQLLEQNKRDIIKNNIDQATLFRQNQIVTRLLEAEKSEMERELDETRKSTEAENYLKSNPEIIFELENSKVNFNDILNSNSIKLNYFYKNKYQIYIKNLN